MYYRDFVKTLSERFEAVLSEIIAVHSFDYGDEFEIAICKILRSALPANYGVCRGHVVDVNGDEAGDDVIIYDSSRFPTLRLLDKVDFSRKEWIPIEAVFAYIEAKHTVELEGTGGPTLRHACTQVTEVKKLCQTREQVSFGALSHNIALPETGLLAIKQPIKESPSLLDLHTLTFSPLKGYPPFYNPCYGTVIARQVRLRKGAPVMTVSSEVRDMLIKHAELVSDAPPDLIMCGSSNLVLPGVFNEANGTVELKSPFYAPGVSEFAERTVEGLAFGIGLCHLLWALNTIQLGTMRWDKIVANAMGIWE
jgi:hypothetical protein